MELANGVLQAHIPTSQVPGGSGLDLLPLPRRRFIPRGIRGVAHYALSAAAAPEPGALDLSSLGMVVFGFRRSRKSSTAGDNVNSQPTAGVWSSSLPLKKLSR